MNQAKLNPHYTFNNFIVKDSNQSAFLAGLIAGQDPMKYSPLFFYGKNGSGKTHLLQSIVERFKQIHKKFILYVTAEDFLNDLMFGVKNGQEATESFWEKYRNNDLLIIDDLQFLAGKKSTQKRLLILMKEFQIQNHPIILSANHHPYHISGLDSDLAQFCHGGLILELK